MKLAYYIDSFRRFVYINFCYLGDKLVRFYVRGVITVRVSHFTLLRST